MKQIILTLALLVGLQPALAAEAGKNQIVEIKVTENGFEPSSIDVKPGTPVSLKITRTTDSTCATQIKIPTKKITKDLPLNKSVNVDLGKLEKGEVRFACGMDMISGHIIVK